MTHSPSSGFPTTVLFALLTCMQCFTLTALLADEKISVNALPMKPVISNPPPELQWFKTRFGLTWEELAENYSVEEVDQFLKRWRSTYPDDPEAWISSANWNSQQSQQMMLHMSSPEPGIFITAPGSQDGNLGLYRTDEQGSEFVSEGTGTDEARLAEALRLYQEAQHKFPYRVDIYDNLAKFYFTLGQYEKQIATLRSLSRAVMETKRDLEGVNYQTVNASKKDVLFSSFQYAMLDLYEVDSEAALNANLDLALLMTRTLTDHPVAWNNLAVAHERLGNTMGAYQAMQKAYRLDPQDEIIVINMAKYSIELGFRKEAIRHYRWILNNSKQPWFRERARADLELLGASN